MWIGSKTNNKFKADVPKTVVTTAPNISEGAVSTIAPLATDVVNLADDEDSIPSGQGKYIILLPYIPYYVQKENMRDNFHHLFLILSKITMPLSVKISGEPTINFPVRKKSKLRSVSLGKKSKCPLYSFLYN